MKKQFQNYFRDWSNLLSFALALIPAWLMYKYPPRAKVPFYAIFLYHSTLLVFLLALSYLSPHFFVVCKASICHAIAFVNTLCCFHSFLLFQRLFY